jgi:uncharacterized protein (DUF1800 family)
MFSFPSLFAHSALAVGAIVAPALAGDTTKLETPEAPAQHSPGIVWDARAVEHLYNRAGFGARPSEIEEGVRIGQDKLVEKLVTQRANVEPYFVEHFDEPKPRLLKEMSEDEQQKAKRDFREKDRRQLLDAMSWSFERMVDGEDPLQERMTLFWHGILTSSIEQVRTSYEILEQDQFLRVNALGNYKDLLSGILKDPAMLVFLNNNVNRKGNPNENLARELMELFSLGVGNYTEQDIKEAARALTGRGIGADGKYEFHKGQHDDGEKTILGVKAKIDGDDLVKILLDQPACPKYIARRIIAYFEGVEPAKDRLDEYASFLRKNDFQIRPFLKKLFTDPAFYRDEVVGARVQGPIDYLVGVSRRLGLHPPPAVLASGATILGQRLFAPPSVKGWDEGVSWITTSSLMQRGNMAGMLLGMVKMDDVMNQADLDDPPSEPEHPMTERDKPMTPPDVKAPGGEMKPTGGDTIAPRRRPGDKKIGKAGRANAIAFEALRKVEQTGWSPAINFTARLTMAGAKTDDEIVSRMLDDLLAIQAPDETRQRMREFLTAERATLDVQDGHLLEAGPDAERVLRRLAHLILSLPEAQLS